MSERQYNNPSLTGNVSSGFIILFGQKYRSADLATPKVDELAALKATGKYNPAPDDIAAACVAEQVTEDQRGRAPRAAARGPRGRRGVAHA